MTFVVSETLESALSSKCLLVPSDMLRHFKECHNRIHTYAIYYICIYNT